MSIHFNIHRRFTDALQEWKLILPENHHLAGNDLQAIEDSHPPDLEFYYVSIFEGPKLTGVMYLQHFQFSQKHFNKNLIQSPVLKLFYPLLSGVKVNLLVCGNLFRVNFQGFYFLDKENRSYIFDCLRSFRKQMAGNVKYAGILVKDCKREFEESSYDCYLFRPFHQDLTMEMEIRNEWRDFDGYVAALSKKYRQRAIKIRKSVADVERKYLTLDEIIHYRKDIESLYMNVVNKQAMAIGILGSDYFIEMKKQLQERFEIAAFIKDGKLLAFSGHIYYPKKMAMELHYIGFDYKANQQYCLYFNIIFDGIETAILKGYKTLEMGRTAREAKASAGAKGVENHNYIWVKAGLPRLAVNFLSKKFSDKMGEEWLHRNPFKGNAPMHISDSTGH